MTTIKCPNCRGKGIIKVPTRNTFITCTYCSGSTTVNEVEKYATREAQKTTYGKRTEAEAIADQPSNP